MLAEAKLSKSAAELTGTELGGIIACYSRVKYIGLYSFLKAIKVLI